MLDPLLAKLPRVQCNKCGSLCSYGASMSTCFALYWWVNFYSIVLATVSTSTVLWWVVHYTLALGPQIFALVQMGLGDDDQLLDVNLS